MAVEMRSIKVYSSARRAPLRGIPSTEGTRCHGCRHFECIRTEYRTRPWRFYCGRKGREVDPATCGCEGSEVTTREFEPFHKWLKRRREEEGLSQLELAKAIGSSGKNVSKYELGKMRPRTPTRNRIEAVLGKWPGAERLV